MKYTYLIYDGEIYKIGQSKDPKKRLAQLATANPKVELLAYVNSDKVSEKYLHKVFGSRRLFLPNGKRSEWFDLKIEDLAYIRQLMETGEEKIGKGIVPTSGSFQARLHGLNYWDNRVKSNHKWVIKFGKYKGRKLVSMQTDEEIDYLRWFIKAYRHGEIKFSGGGHVYNRFCWWIGVFNEVGYKAIKKYLQDDEGANK